MVHYGEDTYFKNRVVACCRRSLRRINVVGLHEAPCLRLLLQRLPLLLHEQYMYEKVRNRESIKEKYMSEKAQVYKIINDS